MERLILLLISMFFIGCAGEVSERVHLQNTTDPIEAVVADENIYRKVIGQAPLTRGLTCTLYTVPNGTAAIIGASLTTVSSFGYTGTFNVPRGNAADGLSILPMAYRNLSSWYVLRCIGKIVITQSDHYLFELTSDDGSLLYIGGSLLINNDGNHAALTKTAVKFLKKGVHDFRLDYMQGPAGEQALVLKDVESKVFYH